MARRWRVAASSDWILTDNLLGADLSHRPYFRTAIAGAPYRQTDGAVFSVVEGSGQAVIDSPQGQQVLHFAPRDHFVVPSWHTLRLSSAEGCVLFSYSDRPVQQALGIHQEERWSAP